MKHLLMAIAILNLSGCMGFQEGCGAIQAPATYQVASERDTQSGTLEVKVTDGNGVPQVGSAVVMWRESGFVILCSANLEARTGPGGIARFERVLPGKYSVGFGGGLPPYNFAKVTVWANQTATANLTAKQVPGESFTEGGGRAEGAPTPSPQPSPIPSVLDPSKASPSLLTLQPSR